MGLDRRRGLAGVVAEAASKHVWSKEWDKISLGATPPWSHTETAMDKVLFVESGFGCVSRLKASLSTLPPYLRMGTMGLEWVCQISSLASYCFLVLACYCFLITSSLHRCDQHGDRQGGGATKAAVRACRSASISLYFFLLFCLLLLSSFKST